LLKNSPEIILEKDFQQYITTRLESIEADIVVLKGQERVFETRKLSIIELERCLEKTGDNLFRNIVEIQGKSHMVKVIPVIFKSGEDGKILLLVPAVNDWMTTEKLFIFSGVVFVLSFIITNIVIITAFSKKVITPLGKLQAAAGKISEGNLDFEIIEDGDTQIRELCRSFEKMRLKLVEANYTQKKYDESRKMLFSSISHDLKTPITSIKGYVEGILDGVANTPQKVEKYLRTVHSKAVHMDRMIDDLLLYSRLDMHKVSFNFEKTDVLKYFEDCMYEIDIELEKSNIKVELHNNLRGKRYIMIDRDQVRRVVINIMTTQENIWTRNRGK